MGFRWLLVRLTVFDVIWGGCVGVWMCRCECVCVSVWWGGSCVACVAARGMDVGVVWGANINL